MATVARSSPNPEAAREVRVAPVAELAVARAVVPLAIQAVRVGVVARVAAIQAARVVAAVKVAIQAVRVVVRSVETQVVRSAARAAAQIVVIRVAVAAEIPLLHPPRSLRSLSPMQYFCYWLRWQRSAELIIGNRKLVKAPTFSRVNA